MGMKMVEARAGERKKGEVAFALVDGERGTAARGLPDRARQPRSECRALAGLQLGSVRISEGSSLRMVVFAPSSSQSCRNRATARLQHVRRRSNTADNIMITIMGSIVIVVVVIIIQSS